MTKKKVLVTGSNGQLGQCIRSVSKELNNNFQFFFATEEFDITNEEQVLGYFNENNFNYCINCAAYTAVDKAEEENEKAYKVNALGVEYLADACLRTDTTLIHISTDFVFDGKGNKQYTELDKTNPISVYGETKLQGENIIAKKLEKYFIIRTSWLYSEFGNNFVKTMLRLGNERDALNVVSDQIGSPTYAIDLAKVLLNIIFENKSNYGIYHYSNQGQISWFEFAKGIFEASNNDIILKPILTKDYSTLAKRPRYSVLDTSKISEQFNLEIPFWKESLLSAILKVK